MSSFGQGKLEEHNPHIKSLNLTTEQKGDPSVLSKKFVEWTKPKSNTLAAAANLCRLEKGDLSLAEYIDKATILCDQCEYPPEARDRLLRDAIVIGLRSNEAYYKCRLRIDVGRGNRNRSESRCHNTPGWIYATRIQRRPTTNRSS